MEEDPSRPGPDRAREMVESISTELGFVSEQRWAAYTPEDREAFHKKDRMLFTSISAIAKNLFQGSARFVFELLQNADDNSFKKATDQGQVPYVAFRMYRDRVVVDCNEDGFSYKHLKSISAVGESSKSSKAAPLGYIGEKGIGFKSVFMVAWKVTIQSGDFSFFFKHGRNDHGLGMVRPIWFEPTERLPLNMTRMTLQLHAGSPEELGSQETMIRKQLHELQESHLLFLQRLKEIHVSFHDGNDKLKSKQSFSVEEYGTNRMKLIKRVVGSNGEETTTSQIYHLTTHVYTLDRSDGNTYSAQGKVITEYVTSQVILGFPLTTDSIPIEDIQSVYAFLPTKAAGFKFLIQGDFLTQAKREDIEMSSNRNRRIRHAIADAFVKAVREFNEDPILRYTWMRFLPRRGAFFEAFWSELITLMRRNLEDTPVLEALGEPKPRHLIKNLRRCSDDFLDGEGNPLFKDSDPPLYISDNYKPSDLEVLHEYGLQYLKPDEILDLLERDLAMGAESRMMSEKTAKDWHEQVATLLLSIISRPESHLLKRLRSLAILPLKGGRWAAPDKGEVYFPDCASTYHLLPRGLGLTLLAGGESRSSKRGQLFLKLGVVSATVKTVRELIYQRQSDTTFHVSSWVDQFRFLYLTHHTVAYLDSFIDPWVNGGYVSLPKVVGHDMNRHSPHYTEVYYPDNGKYSAHGLLRGQLAESEDIKFIFLHSQYRLFPPSTPQGTVLSWRKWLHRYVGISRFVRLGTGVPEYTELSKELCFVAKHHADKLVGFLRYHWQKNKDRKEQPPEWIKKVQQLQVSCEGGSLRPIPDTFLPLPDLQEISSRYLREGEHFPFIQLDESVERGTYLKNWAFLTNVLGVGVDANLTFYCHILATIRDAQPRQAPEPKRVIDVYTAMYGIYVLSRDKNAVEEQLSDVLMNGPGIICSEAHPNSSSWCEGKYSIWDAPSFFKSATPVRWQFAKILGVTELQVEDSDLGRLFKNVVQLPLLDWRSIIKELERRSSRNSKDALTVKEARDLYRRLGRFRASLSDSAKDEIRTRGLIFNGYDHGGWLTVSQCLWSSATRYRSRAVLSDNYEGLEDFFVDFLGVQTLNAKIVYDELLNQAHTTNPSGLTHLKSQLKILSSFLAEGEVSDPTIQSSTLLGKDVRIFPVRRSGSAEVHLVACPTPFVIPDRQRFASYFADKTNMLDFGLEEVRELSPLFKWLGIESRLISRSVMELSTVDRTDLRPVPTSECKVRRNFKALSRIAFHFGSLRLEKQPMTELLRTLESIQVYETDGISSELHLHLPGMLTVSHNLGQSDLHIHESGSSIEIFVPRNKKRREICYTSKLPSKLFELLMTHPSTPHTSEAGDERGQRLVGVILSSSKSVIPEILEAEGIVHAGVDMDSEEEEDEGSDNESLASETVVASVEGREAESAAIRESSTERQGHYGDVIARHSLRASTTPYSNSSNPRVVDISGGHRARSSTAASPSLIDTDADTYRRILERVVAGARRADFPAALTGSPLESMESLHVALDAIAESSSRHSGEAVRFRSATQLHRDKMVGAAGELYVFEVLKKAMASVTSFNWDNNWQSTIRHLVKPHGEYNNITQWPGYRETADIVYNDESGTLTTILIGSGHLDQSWQGLTPNYLLEVKTTTGSCETAFFMSDSQYRRMRTHRNSRETVYIVFRVFNLNSDHIGVRVYVDPAELEATGGLTFTAGAWSVVPGRRRD